ncbi:flavodoxin domain-containing protein [Methanobacterium sp. SMA-27]|uniref:flavodoxin domain-containing protein n=1 Tax=Methanobacterium sp. SMA-27 TaxID=1495336 RepID=UPI00064E6470|nr:flavodoxin domain-containing protein [Methanobacterium sp. SMA-27]
MKALIIYGTRYGTATGIAEEISKVLKEENVDVDLENAREKKELDVTSYDLVVVGSGIKMGKWTKATMNFLKKNKDALSKRKVALFVTCGAANEEKTIAEGQEKYLDNIAKENLINEPIATGLFGSVYDPNAKQGLIFKLVNRSIKKELEKQGKDPNKKHDYRNWDEIRAWTRNLTTK